MDMAARQRLIDKYLALCSEGNALGAVPMEDFFEGNDDDWSVGRHMQTSRDIPVTEYAEAFRRIRARDDVQEVFVWLNEVPDDRYPEDRKEWPQAHIFFIITSAPLSAIEDWVEHLEPRCVAEGWGLLPEIQVPLPDSELLPGMRPVRLELL